jgi:HEAT repeat protein
MTRLYGSGSSSPDIGRLKQDSDIPSLIHHLNSANLSVQWHAAEALGTCGEKAVPLLFSALQSPFIPVRLGAIEALGAIRDLRAVSPLLGVVHRDASLEVRWAAVLALGEIGSPDAAPFLLYLLRDPNRYLRYGAATTLDRLGWKAADDADTAYLLIARQEWDMVRHLGEAALPPLWDLLRDDDPTTRATIISVIGKIGDQHALAACQKALKDRDPHVRWKAVLASMNCGLASHDLPLMVAGRERTGPDPAAAALLNFLFLGIGYNYLGKWWGFPVFMTYMFVIFNAQLALFLLHLPTVLALVIAYPLTAILGIHTYFLAERMSDTGM